MSLSFLRCRDEIRRIQWALRAMHPSQSTTHFSAALFVLFPWENWNYENESTKVFWFVGKQLSNTAVVQTVEPWACHIASRDSLVHSLLWLRLLSGRLAYACAYVPRPQPERNYCLFNVSPFVACNLTLGNQSTENWTRWSDVFFCFCCRFAGRAHILLEMAGKYAATTPNQPNESRRKRHKSIKKLNLILCLFRIYSRGTNDDGGASHSRSTKRSNSSDAHVTYTQFL